MDDIFYSGLSGYAGDGKSPGDPAVLQTLRTDEDAILGEFAMDLGVDAVRAVELNAVTGHRSDGCA